MTSTQRIESNSTTLQMPELNQCPVCKVLGYRSSEYGRSSFRGRASISDDSVSQWLEMVETYRSEECAQCGFWVDYLGSGSSSWARDEHEHEHEPAQAQTPAQPPSDQQPIDGRNENEWPRKRRKGGTKSK